MSSTSKPQRYCVIGAGAAGLAAVHALRANGITVDGYERAADVAGHWHHDYESLHLITSRTTSGFDGFPMPASYPTYPSRDQMRDYLMSYADEYDLRKFITFSTEVTRVRSAPEADGGGWIVTTDNGDERRYRGVLVANGHLTEPMQPTYPGIYTGKSLHAAQYKTVDDLGGDSVLVVGAGNSGCDLAVDAAHARKRTSISIRSGQIFQPKAFFGQPRADLRWLRALPPRVQELVSRSLVRMFVGSYASLPGLARPASFNLDKQRPIVNDLLPYWIRHGRITARPGIERLDGTKVHFVDGTAEHFDTILWATGYKVTLPFLADDRLQWRDGVPLRLAATTVPVHLPDLYFIGLGAPRGPQLPTYSAEAKLVIRLMRVREQLPVDWAARFGAAMRPTSSIDLLRHLWLNELKTAHRIVDEIEREVSRGPLRTRRTSPVSASTTSSQECHTASPA